MICNIETLFDSGPKLTAVQFPADTYQQHGFYKLLAPNSLVLGSSPGG